MATKDGEPAKRANQQTIDQWVSRIDETIGKQRRNVFEFGDLLLTAESELSKSALKKVYKASGLKSESNANNYMRIAECKHLRDPEIINHLPATLGVLIDLAGPYWGSNSLRAAIKEGVLNPSTERGKLKKWMDRKIEEITGKSVYLDLLRSMEDGESVAFIVANKNTKYDIINLLNHISSNNKSVKIKNSSNQTYSIIIEDISEKIFISREGSKSHSALVASSIFSRISRKYGNELRDEYIADGMTDIFGSFEEFQRNMQFEDFRCFRLLVEKEAEKQRKILEIDDEECDFLRNYYELRTSISVGYDKVHSPRKE